MSSKIYNENDGLIFVKKISVQITPLINNKNGVQQLF
jgi:hypothetical protein